MLNAEESGGRAGGLSPDMLNIRQAELLRERASSSALSVLALVLLYATILTFTAPLSRIALWATSAAAMIGVTLLLARSWQAHVFTGESARRYLGWHTGVSALTGLVWGGGAVWLTDYNSQLSIVTTGVMVLSLALGGISPQSVYRRSYVALATTMLLPYAAAVLVAAPWPLSATGAGALLAYAFFMSASARVEIASRDAIAVHQNKVLTEELRRQRDALQALSEEKTRFLAATSHDLAQPLHAQGFFIAALREKLRDPAELDLLSKIEASWRGLGGLLDGLVDISRLDAGAIVPDKRNVDLAHLARRVADEFADLAARERIGLTVDTAPAFVRTDPILFGRILRNLLSNAVKFTGAGGHVAVKVETREGEALLTVADTGPGIPPSQQEAVFREYVQLGNRERNREKGLGLGLSIVRRLSGLLGVTVLLQSDTGQGVRFSLSLPASGGAGSGMDGGAAVARPDISNLSILLVDDEDAIRSGMATVLTSWGCEVLTAAGEEAALSLLAGTERIPDLLIVDRRLPGGDTGLALVERLRDEVNEDVHAILMTGDISTGEEEGKLANAHFLHKPVEPAMLHGLLATIVREGRERDEAPLASVDQTD